MICVDGVKPIFLRIEVNSVNAIRIVNIVGDVNRPGTLILPGAEAELIGMGWKTKLENQTGNPDWKSMMFASLKSRAVMRNGGARRANEISALRLGTETSLLPKFFEVGTSVRGGGQIEGCLHHAGG